MSTTVSHPVSDIATMLRRNLRHAQRYPGVSLGTLGMPVVMLLLFGVVFGKTFKAGLGGGDFNYIDYLIPGILLITVTSGTMGPAIAVCTDMAEGIVARFRTMSMFRPAVLTGAVLGSVLQILASLALVLGFALLIGFRPNASFGDWLLVVGLLVALTVAFTWLAVALGLVSKTPEGASNIVLPLNLLFPFLSTTFIPLEAMPKGIRWFAEYQPFTPIIETLRHLLIGTPAKPGDGWVALAWCAAIAVVGYFWAQKNYNKGTVA
ncbi:MAG TPA: ABC transporter permease [Kribbella sp.]|jgi:ABC-2 type transport system permease protein